MTFFCHQRAEYRVDDEHRNSLNQNHHQTDDVALDFKTFYQIAASFHPRAHAFAGALHQFTTNFFWVGSGRQLNAITADLRGAWSACVQVSKFLAQG